MSNANAALECQSLLLRATIDRKAVCRSRLYELHEPRIDCAGCAGCCPNRVQIKQRPAIRLEYSIPRRNLHFDLFFRPEACGITHKSPVLNPPSSESAICP